MRHLSNVEAAWIAFAVLFPVVLYLLCSAFQTRQRIAERKALIDKFTSAEGFAAFLQSPSGQKFMSDLSFPEMPTETMIGAIQKGIVLIALGGGVWYIGVAREAAVEILSIGILLVCLGFGLVVSAAISYRLSKSWGLMDKAVRDGERKTTES